MATQAQINQSISEGIKSLSVAIEDGRRDQYRLEELINMLGERGQQATKATRELWEAEEEFFAAFYAMKPIEELKAKIDEKREVYNSFIV